MTGPELLAAWIERSKMTQRQTAAFIGISEGKLSMYLSGRCRPGVDVVLRIQDTTGVSARSWTLSGLSKSEKIGIGGGPNVKVLPDQKA